ncbi:hypothetical protein CsatB_007737 [Cannabis sativa]
MSHPNSETCPSKFVTPECTNHFSSPYAPNNFKPQFKSKTKDSKAVELPINPNQGDVVDRYGKSSQEIFERMEIDSESEFRGPPQANMESKRKVVSIDVVMDSTKEPNWPKTEACTRSLGQPNSGVEKFLEARNEFSAAGNGIF